MRRISTLLAAVLCLGSLSPSVAASGTPAAVTRPARQLSCPGGDGSVAVLSRHVVDEPAGTIGVYLDVRNRTRAWRGQLRGHLCFYDAQGHLVDTGMWFSDQIAIGPRQRISTYLSEDPPSSWDRVKVTFRSKKTRLRAVSHHVQVTPGKVGRYVADAFADAEGLHHVRVQVEAFRKR